VSLPPNPCGGVGRVREAESAGFHRYNASIKHSLPK
jgi:hypothetical protein